MNATKLHSLSREALYEKVWSTSSVKLAEELGVSDVAINKRCRRLNVPRPPRGYWAKIEAGHKSKRPPLPPFMTVAGSDETKRFAERRADLNAAHPLAEEFLKALQTTALSYDKLRVQVTTRAVPEALISKELAPHAAKVFNLLLQKTESQGIQFSRSLSKHDGGQFRLGNDRLKFKMEEELVDKPVEPKKGRRSYSSFWLTQKMMAALYDVSVPAINQRLKRIFSDSELDESSVVKQCLTTATDGKTCDTGHGPHTAPSEHADGRPHP